MKELIILFVFTSLVFNTAIAQDDKKKFEQDFERYKQERNLDYQNFVKKREAELKKMEQEYLNFYNQMMGLKTELVESGEPEKAELVQDMIDYENTIAKTLNYKIAERAKDKISPSENANKNTKEPEVPVPKKESENASKTNNKDSSNAQASN